MDVLGVQRTKKIAKMKKHSNKRRCKEAIKVVYISSPMKVKTCASKFRDLVQELTGKDSDAANAPCFNIGDVDRTENSPKLQLADDQDAGVVNDPYCFDGSAVSTESQLMSSLSDQSPSISGSEMEMSFEDVFMPHREGSFLGMFNPNLFSSSESFLLDHHAFKSFDSV